MSLTVVLSQIYQSQVTSIQPIITQNIPQKQNIISFLNYVSDSLSKTKFFANHNKKEAMIENITNTFTRMDLSDQDIKTLFGIIRVLNSNATSDNSNIPD
jgi:tRNA C32,U32 (ribose-2'-O)-methylase TrmJ